MRIIAGEFRGRKLLPPEGEVTRPITDRVKQSLFDILAPGIEGSAVLDLFAGTGSMGLECLSRGAIQATFFETDRSATKRLNENIRLLGLDKSKAIVRPSDVFRWFDHQNMHRQAEPSIDKKLIDLAFLDPPYRYVRERPADLRRLAERLAATFLHPDGIVVFRHDAGDALELPPLKQYDSREYGGMALDFLRAQA